MHLAGGRQVHPGTVNDFGGSSTTEFGSLEKTLFPEAGFTTATLIRNFSAGT
jgi:hypothetical protein